MDMMEATETTRKTTATVGPCGKRHRAGTQCLACERVLRRQSAAEDALAALRTLPAGTIAVLDTRTGRGRVRTLPGADEVALRFADACADTKWVGTEWRTAAGESVRFVTNCGGFVPVSYGYPANADWVYVVAADGRVVVCLERARTQRRPHGVGAVRDVLLRADTIRDVVERGKRYNAAWMVGVRSAARWARLLARRQAGMDLRPEDDVALDRALELGWVE